MLSNQTFQNANNDHLNHSSTLQGRYYSAPSKFELNTLKKQKKAQDNEILPPSTYIYSDDSDEESLHSNEELLDSDEESLQVIEPEARKSICNLSTISTGLQVVTGTAGFAAGLLYWNSMKPCTEISNCAGWLADLTSPHVAWVAFFASGGGGYGISNIYFSAQSIPAVIQLWNDTPSIGYKLVKTVLLSTYLSTQVTGHIFASEGGADPNGDKLLQHSMTAGAVAGAFPGMLSSGVNLVRSDLPSVYSNLQDTLVKVRRLISEYAPSLAALSEQEQMRLHYMNQRKLFSLKAHASFQHQMDNLQNLNSDQIVTSEYSTPLCILFNNHKVNPKTQSWGAYFAELGFKTNFTIGASVLAGSFTVPIVLNSISQVGKLLSDTATQHLLSFLPFSIPVEAAYPIGLLFTATGTYNSFKLNFTAANWLFKALKNIFTGHAIGSIPLQRHFIKTLFFSSIAFGSQALSYGLIAVQWQRTYKDEWPEKEAFGYLADAGIILYHSFAMVLLFETLLSRFVKNPIDKYLFDVEKKIEALEQGALEHFITFVNELPPEEQAILELQAYKTAGELVNIQDQPRELLPLDDGNVYQKSYEKEATNSDESDEEEATETNSLIKKKPAKPSTVGLFAYHNSPAATNIRAAVKEQKLQRQNRCCGIQ